MLLGQSSYHLSDAAQSTANELCGTQLFGIHFHWYLLRSRYHLFVRDLLYILIQLCLVYYCTLLLYYCCKIHRSLNGSCCLGTRHGVRVHCFFGNLLSTRTLARRSINGIDKQRPNLSVLPAWNALLDPSMHPSLPCIGFLVFERTRRVGTFRAP